MRYFKQGNSVCFEAGLGVVQGTSMFRRVGHPRTLFGIKPDVADACQLWGGTIELDEFDGQCYCTVGSSTKKTRQDRCAGLKPGQSKNV